MVDFCKRDGTKLAYRHLPGADPTLVFLPGYMSDMSGSKASALFDWARENGRGCLLFDYSGCGQSGGDFDAQTLESWRDDVLFLIGKLTQGPVVLIGSSMGGWLMLPVALALVGQDGQRRLAGLVGVAAAPDFTQWGFTEAEKAGFARGETLFGEPMEGNEEIYRTTPAFWRSGQANLLLDGEITLDCPARLIHGQADDDVPADVSLRLATALRSDDVQTILIKRGGHRLSDPGERALLIANVAELADPD